MLLSFLLIFLQAVSSRTPHVNPDATPYPETVTIMDWPFFWVMVAVVVGLLLLGFWKLGFSLPWKKKGTGSGNVYKSSILLAFLLFISVSAVKADCIGSQMNGYIGTSSTYATRIPGANVDIYRLDFGFWVYQNTVFSQYFPGGGEHGLWTYYTDECGEYKAVDVVIPYAFLPCTLNRSEHNWNFAELGIPRPWFGTGANFHCV